MLPQVAFESTTDSISGCHFQCIRNFLLCSRVAGDESLNAPFFLKFTMELPKPRANQADP